MNYFDLTAKTIKNAKGAKKKRKHSAFSVRDVKRSLSKRYVKKLEPLAKPVEPRPVEPKPVEPKPVEPKPVEPKPVAEPVKKPPLIVGNTQVRQQFNQWVRARGGGVALLHGPPGVGKTLTAMRGLQSFRVVDVLAEQETVAGAMTRIRTLTTRKSLMEAQSAVLVDGVDMLPTHDRTAMVRLLKQILSAPCPVVCVVNDKYVVRALASCAHVACFCFFTLSPTEIMTLLRHHGTRQAGDVARICKAANGDCRKALNDARFASVCSEADVREGPFDTVASLFAKRRCHPGRDPHLMRGFVDENALRFCRTVREAAEVTAHLSDLHTMSPMYPSAATEFGATLCPSLIRRAVSARVQFPSCYGNRSKQQANRAALAALRRRTSVTPTELSLLLDRCGNSKTGRTQYLSGLLVDDDAAADRLQLLCVGKTKSKKK